MWKETKEFLLFLVALIVAVFKIGLDRKFKLTEVGDLLPAALKSSDAFEGFKLILAEIGDATDEQIAELRTWLREQLNLAENYLQWEIVIEDGIMLLVLIVKFVLRIIFAVSAEKEEVLPVA